MSFPDSAVVFLCAPEAAGGRADYVGAGILPAAKWKSVGVLPR
jgi:hypothetical protein